MLTSEFTQEMGALIRSLENRVRNDPTLTFDTNDKEDVLHEIDDAIIVLIALRFKIQRLAHRDL